MRIAIIGAGCSGLTAIKNLVEAGLTDIVCYEKNDQIGGNWVYTATPGHSSVNEATHIISSKAMSQLSDFPMPDDYPDYPSHRQILAYFQAYARHFQLDRYIRLNTTVLHAEKIVNERWRLHLDDGTQREFDYLLVANGHHSVPRHPDWKNCFTGKYLHAHDYKTSQGLEGKHILVVGAGNSGCDCAVESSRVAMRVDMSFRSPQYIIPKFIMGKPTDVFAAAIHWLPQGVQNWLQKISLRLQIGRYRDYALPEPDFSPTQAHPTINSALFDRIRHGKVHPRPAIASVTGQTIHFADGSTSEYDVIIAATGYKISFPFFDRAFLNWEETIEVPLFMRIFHPDHPSLFFIGLIQPQGCIWPLTDLQSRLLGQLLINKIKLPPNWRERAIAEAKYWQRQFIARPRHSIEVHYRPYMKQLLRILEPY
ncbi:Predicted flavoprotein CzcO associated with the cation diffusion facilitator CzcD [Nitrosomonas nitrosa]|uniref:Predicted flavoprotein CzcO associated with the cation diffusion facilitator CzcD n=1 Tax=Nitrosomonas nitrosa TaxID=52442 RepID=A0A1I4SGK5_9PROT|nr:NAD(P)-binding domain-containing protein [Nitrosomonas nitrosa]SFM63616.1 Predicted flavoprotein CzcO associated with the cation diffusion facilitator CzcD [Nitrosomonas nitrosa]